MKSCSRGLLFSAIVVHLPQGPLIIEIKFQYVNILHVSTALSWRGGEQQLANLIKANKNSCNNIVFCARGSVMQSHCEHHKILHHTFRKRFPGLYLAASSIKKQCKRHRISLIHCHDSHAHTIAFLSALFFGNKSPIIVHRRVDFPIGKSWLSRHKYNYKTIAGYICVSEAIRKILIKDLKHKEKAITIYSGIDFSRFDNYLNNRSQLKNELGLAGDAILIGNTAALAPHKDYDTFIRTAHRLLLRHPDWHFVIMGDGPLRRQVENRIASLNLKKSIILTGFRNDLPALLPGLDIFLMTSKTEGLGTSLLDAFYLGIPVVATKAGGISELVDDETTGLLAEVGDDRTLARQVERLIMGDKLRKLVCANARKKVIHFSHTQTANRTIQYYQDLLTKYKINQ